MLKKKKRKQQVRKASVDKPEKNASEEQDWGMEEKGVQCVSVYMIWQHWHRHSHPVPPGPVASVTRNSRLD